MPIENPLLKNARQLTGKRVKKHVITFSSDEIEQLRSELKLRPDDLLPKNGKELFDMLMLATAVVSPSVAFSRDAGDNTLIANAKRRAAK